MLTAEQILRVAKMEMALKPPGLTASCVDYHYPTHSRAEETEKGTSSFQILKDAETGEIVFAPNVPE